MPLSSSSPILFLLLLWCPELCSYEAPEDKQDVFAKRPCPAFLTFTNAAYLAGVTVELPCHCKPEKVQSVVWFFRKHLDDSKETKVLTDHYGNKLLDPSDILQSRSLQSRFSIRLFSLLIFRASPDDSGIYICGSAHRDYFYGFDLDIQDVDKISFIQRLTSDTTSMKMKPGQRPGSGQPLYQLFTTFQPWLVCDRCGVPGEQVRIGLCHVHSHFLHVRYRGANQTEVSCGSGGVPRAFRLLKRNIVRAKMDVKSCQVTCSTQTRPSSKLISLLTFLGFSSAAHLQELPVFYLNHPTEHILTLGCPGARPNMAVAWDRGSEPIYRSKHLAGGIGNAETPRLQIDAGHHLVFNPAKIQDSGVYTCWLQGHQAAQIYLLVYAHLGHGQSVTSHRDFPEAMWNLLKSYIIMMGVFCLLMLIRAGVRILCDTADEHLD